MRSKRYVWTFCVFTVIVLLAGLIFSFVRVRSAAIQNGKLDLSVWDGKHVIALVGKTEFLRENSLDQQEPAAEEPEALVNFPSYWNYDTIGEKRLSDVGYGAYRIHVTGADPGRTLALRIPPYLTACRIYINGNLAASGDKNGASEDGSKYEVEIFEFAPASESFDIVIQAPSYGSSFGGVCSVPYLGSPGQIGKINSVICGYDIFIIAFLFIVIFYNVFYYFLRKDLFFVVFILMCLMMVGRTLINGSFLIGNLFSDTSLSTVIYIDCITMYFLPAAWLSITYFSNAVVLSKTPVKLSLFLATIATLASLIVPISALAWLYLLSEFIWLVTAIYVILKLFDAMSIKKLNRIVAFLLLSGITILTFCSVLNIFQSIFAGRGLLDFLPTGLILYTLLWDYSYTYQYDVLLKDRLKVLEELNTANENGRALELKFLKSQIRPHFINNVLNTVIAVSLTDPERSRGLLCYFSTYLKSCYDFGDLGRAISLEDEISTVKAYMALEEARYTDSLRVEYRIDSVSIDIPQLILQPLVENAIIHNKISKKTPLTIWVYVIDSGDTVKIGVGDNGQGFDSEKIPSLLRGEMRGQGVGICNVNRRLEKIYGTTLRIENREGGGCDVYMIIPNKS